MVDWPSILRALAFPATGRSYSKDGAQQTLGKISAIFKSTRPRIHYVYYFIAAFNVAIVALGLHLSWHSGNSLRTTVETNQDWRQLHQRVAELRLSVNKLYEPAKAVFNSPQPQQERAEFDKAVAAFEPALSAVRVKATSLLPASDRQSVLGALDHLELTIANIVVRTKILLSVYQLGDVKEASIEMALANRHYARALSYIDTVTSQLHAVEAQITRRNAKHSMDLRATENILLLMLIVMVLAATAYGHFIGTMVEKNFADVEDLNATLEQQGIALKQQNMRLDETLRQLPHGVSWFDSNDKLVVCNDLYRELFGLPEQLTRAGTPHDTIRDHRCEFGGNPSSYADVITHDANATADSHTLWQRSVDLSDGRAIAVANIPMPEGGYLRTFTDITEKARLEQKIAHQARHDSLTGLLNRNGFNEEVQRVLELMKRGQVFAVIYMDLDHFKQVNDTLGHPIGDGLLQQVADRLRSCVRKTDIAARIGGDEFAIIQVLADQPDAAKTLAERLIQEIAEPFEVEGHQITVGTSIGIVVAPDDGTAIDVLLKNADLALYRSKAEGRGVYKFFEPEMDAKMQARRRLELDLRQALVEEQFQLHYQPLVETETGRIRAFEALLRWKHPQRGIVAPLEFIPLAEEVGLMGRIGSWVVKQACLDAAHWPDSVSVAVNVSPVQFRDRSIEFSIVEALAKSELPPHRLEIEITESALLENIEQTQETLKHIRTLGVRIALDDFGTGYSSLSYLKDFPFDKVKIDRSFIQSSSNDGESSIAIIRAIVGMSSSLGMGTTAEGIETEEQLEKLTAEGCSELQGFLFGKPIPATKIDSVLSVNGAQGSSPIPRCA